MKRLNYVLCAAVLVLVLSMGIGSAWAYFTTYAEARGGYTIELGGKTELREEFSAWTKHVAITNAPDSVPVYIRAKAFCGSQYELVYMDESGKWSPGADGFYYYSDPVAGGETTAELQILIDNVPVDVNTGDSFNVIVVYESTPVQYHADGTPYADWNVVLDTGTSEGGDD